MKFLVVSLLMLGLVGCTPEKYNPGTPKIKKVELAGNWVNEEIRRYHDKTFYPEINIIQIEGISYTKYIGRCDLWSRDWDNKFGNAQNPDREKCLDTQVTITKGTFIYDKGVIEFSESEVNGYVLAGLNHFEIGDDVYAKSELISQDSLNEIEDTFGFY